MRYTLLGNSGLRVSELALGTMTFGEDWGWGADVDACRAMFDAYVAAGGNFLDTANNYTNGSAERLVGELVGDDRDQFVVATKYTLSTRDGDPNACGNHRKNLYQAVEGSLDRLDTDYIDLLWVHAWDELTPVSEVMRGLDDLVSAGTVHYVGISDTPAWVIARAQTLAEERNLTPFCAVQLPYSPLERTPERELLPMARELDLGVTVWGALSGGALTGKYLESESTEADDAPTVPDGGDDSVEDDTDPSSTGRLRKLGRTLTTREHEIVRVVVDVAAELDVPPAQVALAWIRHQRGQFVPILGARTASQLAETMGCLEVTLSVDHLERIDEVSAVDMGFPGDFLAQPVMDDIIYGGVREFVDPYRE